LPCREKERLVYEFALLGIQKSIAVSATHGYQIAELLEAAFAPLSFDEKETPEEEIPKIAIIGRTNVGKSTLLNALVGEERSIVSPDAGTTRDSIDSVVSYKLAQYLFIDTAGIRRRHKERHVVEKFAHMRTERAIARADICLLVIDALQGCTTEEKRIANAIEEANKGCIILCNKWDEAHGFRMEHTLKALEMEVPFFAHCPRLCISAKTKRNVDKIYPEIESVLASFSKRIPTGELNRALIAAMQHYHPPVIGGRRLKIYYMAQVGIQPPHFILFVNDPALMDATYKKYLTNCLRDVFGFFGVPILFQLKAKERLLDRRARKPTSSHKDRDLQHLEDASFHESSD
jgi:GTP-binding protein